MEGMVLELLVDKDNQWIGTMRQPPEKWTSAERRKVYGFPRQGEGMASWIDRFKDGKFSTPVNPKDGYAVFECKDVRAKTVLAFLILILYPKKPTRVKITIGNTIFGALSGERLIDWAIVMRDVIQRVFVGMERSKATPICPYLFHLHYAMDNLLSGKKKAYQIAEAFLKRNVEPDHEDELAEMKDLQAGLLFGDPVSVSL